MYEHGAANKAADLLDEVRGQQHRLVFAEYAEQHLVEVLTVENVVAAEGLVHEDIVRALAERQHGLKLVLLTGGELARRHGERQLGEVHQHVEALAAEGWEVVGVELRVAERAEVGEKRVLARGEGYARDVPAANRLTVERYRAVVADEAEYALHERGLAGAVLSEKAHELPARQAEAYVTQRGLAAVILAYVLYFQHT